MSTFLFATARSGNSYYGNLHDYIDDNQFKISHFHKQSYLLKTIGAYKNQYGLYSREVFSNLEFTQSQVFENFERYKALPHKPFVSVIAGMTPDSIVDWMMQNYEPIWLERRNKLDQILSWGQAYYSKKYNVKRSIEYNSLEYQRSDWDYIVSTFKQYNRWKSIYQTSYSKCLYTENVVDIQVKDQAENCLPEKNSNPDKIKYFTNQQQILNWYNEFEDSVA